MGVPQQHILLRSKVKGPRTLCKCKFSPSSTGSGNETEDVRRMYPSLRPPFLSSVKDGLSELGECLELVSTLL